MHVRAQLRSLQASVWAANPSEHMQAYGHNQQIWNDKGCSVGIWVFRTRNTPSRNPVSKYVEAFASYQQKQTLHLEKRFVNDQQLCVGSRNDTHSLMRVDVTLRFTVLAGCNGLGWNRRQLSFQDPCRT